MKFWNPCYRSENKKSSLLLRLCFYNFQQLNSYTKAFADWQSGIWLIVFNLFADLWKQMGMKALLNKAGFSKRSGAPIYELVYVLVLWVWLKKDSIGMFARDTI
jgi:hypothetical protein